jgi:hypothetical protein
VLSGNYSRLLRLSWASDVRTPNFTGGKTAKSCNRPVTANGCTVQPLLVPVNELLIDQAVREIILAPWAVVTVVDPGQGGSHAGRSRHADFAVDQQDFHPVPDLFDKVQQFRGLRCCERVSAVRVRGIGEHELQQPLAVVA